LAWVNRCPNPGCAEVPMRGWHWWPPPQSTGERAGRLLCEAAAVASAAIASRVAGPLALGSVFASGDAARGEALACAAGGAAAALVVVAGMRADRAALEVRGQRVTCGRCERHLCFACKAPWHGGKGCDEAEDTAVAAWAAASDTCRCPQCGTIIERSAGCNHMVI